MAIIVVDATPYRVQYGITDAGTPQDVGQANWAALPDGPIKTVLNRSYASMDEFWSAFNAANGIASDWGFYNPTQNNWMWLLAEDGTPVLRVMSLVASESRAEILMSPAVIEQKHSGAQTATWLVSNVLPYGFLLNRNHFAQLPKGRLKDVLMASYSDAPPTSMPNTPVAGQFMDAFATVGGYVSLSWGRSPYNIDPSGNNQDAFGNFRYINGMIVFVMAGGPIGLDGDPPVTSYATLKFSTNYSAGR